MSTSLPTARDAVTDYVDAVRAELTDLGPEVVEELTGGLEADLGEALFADRDADPDADPDPDPDAAAAGVGAGPRRDDLVARFGPPAEYAAELRAAAGLQARAAVGGERRGVGSRLGGAVDGWWQRWLTVTAPVLRQPWWPELRDSIAAMRPAWWVLRAYLAARLLWTMDGSGPWPPGFLWMLVSIAATVISVWWGRRVRGGVHGFQRAALGGLNAFAVLVLLTGLADVGRQPYDQQAYPGDVASSGDGVYLGGEQLHNLFVYDAEGKLVQGAQLYDERGRPVTLGQAASTWAGEGAEYYGVPWLDSYGRERWNAFPLGVLPAPWDTSTQLDDNGRPIGFAQQVAPPMELAPRLSPPVGNGVTPTPTPTPPATATPAVTPSADPASPTPSSTPSLGASKASKGSSPPR